MSFIGTQELLMILLVAVLVVGPKRLPDLAKKLGKGIRNFKDATSKMRSDLDESGAMDEINQIRDHVKGIANDVKPNLQFSMDSASSSFTNNTTVDGTTAPLMDTDGVASAHATQVEQPQVEQPLPEQPPAAHQLANNKRVSTRPIRRTPRKPQA